jgi:hypothetical protein
MKEVARYNGKVISLATPPQASSVRLTEVGSGNSVETGAVTDTLIRAGLKEGDDFVVIIQESNGHTSGIIRKPESKTETDFDI